MQYGLPEIRKQYGQQAKYLGFEARVYEYQRDMHTGMRQVFIEVEERGQAERLLKLHRDFPESTASLDDTLYGSEYGWVLKVNWFAIKGN